MVGTLMEHVEVTREKQRLEELSDWEMSHLSAEGRLAKCQAALVERGVKNVKFFFGKVSEKPVSQIASDVADALEAVNAGQAVIMPALDDSRRL